MVQDQVVEEQLIDLAAEEAAEIGTLKSMEDLTAEMGEMARGRGGMNLMSTADKVPVWNTETGRQGWAMTDMLKFQLRKRFPANHPKAGQRVFSLKPVDEPDYEGVLCYLHPQHPDRAYFDSLGIAGRTCAREKPIPSEYSLRLHMMKRHSLAWRIITEARQQQAQREQFEIQRAQVDAIQKLAGGSPQVDAPPDMPDVFRCEEEGCIRFFDNEHALLVHKGKEHK